MVERDTPSCCIARIRCEKSVGKCISSRRRANPLSLENSPRTSSGCANRGCDDVVDSHEAAGRIVRSTDRATREVDECGAITKGIELAGERCGRSSKSLMLHCWTAQRIELYLDRSNIRTRLQDSPQSVIRKLLE